MSEKNKGNFYILLTALLWSTGGLLIKFIPGNPIVINGSRCLVALLFFFVYKRSVRIRLNRYVVAAAMCLFLTNTLYVIANKMTAAANAIVLQYTAPLFVLIWDCIYRKEKPKKKQLLLVTMAFAGMVLFFFDQLEGGQILGNVIAIGAGLMFSGVFFINSLPDSSSEDASMLAFLISFITSVPFLGTVAEMDAVAIGAILVLGIFQVGLAYALFSKGSKLTSPVNASLIGLLEAILNPLWVFLIFGEKIGKFALVGAAIILLAVIMNTVSGKNETK